MLELFLMVSSIPDMLPHDGDHYGKGLSDIGAVSDGLHSPLYVPYMLPHDGYNSSEGQYDVGAVPDGLCQVP